jgi:hypothetical protein
MDSVPEQPFGGAFERCEIVLRRGYVKGQFYARDENDAYIAGSPMFRLRGRSTVRETDAALAAQGALVDALVEGGWEPYDRGRAWYADRFVRRRLGDG